MFWFKERLNNLTSTKNKTYLQYINGYKRNLRV